MDVASVASPVHGGNRLQLFFLGGRVFPAAAHMQATRQTNKPSIRNIRALTNTIKSLFVGVRLGGGERWAEGRGFY